jgi:hypothetical protein
MVTATQRPVSLRVGEFQIETLGVEYPDYFQGFGLGPRSKFTFCAYGIGDTEEEAFQDCLEMVAQQGFDVDDETEARIREGYGPIDDETTAAEYLDLEEFEDSPAYVHIGIKWNCREEERLERIKKLANVDFLHYQDYCPQGPSSRYSGLQEWGYTRRIDPDSKAVSYGDLMKPADCPDSAVAYLEGLSTDATEEGELYFFLPYASGSDYSGSTVEKANYKEFLESYGEEGFVWEAHGGFDTYAVVLGLTGLLECADDTFNAILDIIEGLEDYPLINDEALSNLESDLADEAWDCWVAGEFQRALEKKFDCAEFEWPADSDLRTFFEKKAEEANEYWFNEGYGPDMYIRVDEIVEGIDLDDLADYTVLYLVTYVDVGQETEEFTSESEAIERVDSLRAAGFIGASYTAVSPAK